MVSRERGSAAVELTLLAPLVVLLLLLVVAAGRLVSVRLAVDDAAHQAARTLTVARGPVPAADAAREVAASALAGRVNCRQVTVTMGMAPDMAGGSATVTVSCVVQLSDLAGLALPSTRTITGTASSPMDIFRGTT